MRHLSYIPPNRSANPLRRRGSSLIMIATFLTRRRGVLEQGFWRQDAPDMDRSVLSEDAIDKLPDSPFAGSRL